MSSLIRPLVPALALVFASSLALAESIPSASDQDVSAPVAAQPSPAVQAEQQASPPPVESNDVAQSVAGSVADDAGALAGEVKSLSSEGETGPTEATAAPTDSGRSDAAAAAIEADGSDAASSDNDMPSHAPLRANAERAERRRRVPLVMFSDFHGLARFTEAEPAIHEKARSIANRTTASAWVSIGSSLATGVLLGASMTAPQCEILPDGPRCHPNLGLVLTAAGTFVVGHVIAYLVSPKPQDLVEVVDAWNATVDEPIVPEPGLDPRGTDVPDQQGP